MMAGRPKSTNNFQFRIARVCSELMIRLGCIIREGATFPRATLLRYRPCDSSQQTGGCAHYYKVDNNTKER